MKKTLLLLIISIFSIALTKAQTGDVRGFVYDKETGEPILFANVYFNGTTIGTNTDLNGFYSLSKVPVGTYTLTAYVIGFDTATQVITVKAGSVSNYNLYISSSNIELDIVEINEKRTERTNDSKVSVVKITPEQIKKLPSVGGSPDLAQYISIVPGVVFTGDQGGQLYIRGGSPIQNKVMLDGMTIYNPFHSIGLFSVFDVDIIRSMDVYTGGYPAEYGGRISAVLDIKTREGNKTRTSGNIQASPFTAKAMLEGPIKKFKLGEGASSYIVTARTSYLDKTAPIFYDYADSNNLPYSFNDIYGKYSTVSPTGSKLDLFGFSFNDNANFDATQYNWQSLGVGSKFIFLPPNSSTVVEGNFAWSDYGMTQTEEDNSPRTSKISGFEAGVDFSYFVGSNQVRYGADFIGFSTDFSYRNSADRTVAQQSFTTEMAGYVHYKYKSKSKKLILEPGLRLHYFASLAELSPEPRLMGKYILSKKFRLKFSSGMYAQNLLSAISDRDVVNLFYGFLSGPENIPTTFRGEDVISRLQKAKHAIFGFEYDLNDANLFNVEGYYKRFSQLTNINRNKIFDDTKEYEDKDAYLRKDYIIEKGDAYGVDFNYEYDKNRLYIWMVYSLSWVTREDEKTEYAPHWDRRHNANVLITYELGKKKKFNASLRWNLGSGFPFTQTQGYYELIGFQGGINTDYTTENGDLGIIYGETNQGRLPYYHRLDASLNYTYTIDKYKRLEIVASVTNVYNRENIFYFNRVTHSRVNQLPILPSLGATFYF